MNLLQRLIGKTIVRSDALTRPLRFKIEKKRVLKRYPQLQFVMEAFEKHYIQVEFGAHDRSLIERRERQITDSDEFVYGTTPWLSFLKVLETLDLSDKDVFIEPGCGMGHLCFLVHQIYAMECIGIEALGNFIHTGNQIKAEVASLPDPKKLKLYNLDFFQCDFSRGTVFYVAGTCFPLDYKQRLIEKIAKEAAAGSTLITLTHDVEHDAFVFSHEVRATFSWGRDRALIYTRK